MMPKTSKQDTKHCCKHSLKNDSTQSRENLLAHLEYELLFQRILSK